jgi:glyoxylase-like metal-dependent hydrolase (beta-lactamase superfamily II)
MELRALKHGDLMGSPDTKIMLHRTGAGSQAASALWQDIARLKIAHGWTGRATSVLLLDSEEPELFPAVVDLSYISPDPSGADTALDEALSALVAEGISPAEVMTVLFTHCHADHFDERLLEHMPHAQIYGPAGSGIPGALPLLPERFGTSVRSLNTPGHGTPHASYIVIVELADQDLTMCIAGDVIMSHAHFLCLDHPLSFADNEAGRRSVEAIIANLSAARTTYTMILPGHDRPFFVIR